MSVSVARCGEYDQNTVAASLARALEPLGGMAAFVSPGARVLVKTNLLSRALPERAVTTHPEVIRAVVREVLAAGGEPVVADSPGGPNTPGQWKRISEDTGIARVCAEEGVRLALLDEEQTRVSVPGGALYQSFTLGARIAEGGCRVVRAQDEDARLHDVHGRREEPLRMRTRP